MPNNINNSIRSRKYFLDFLWQRNEIKRQNAKA